MALWSTFIFRVQTVVSLLLPNTFLSIEVQYRLSVSNVTSSRSRSAITETQQERVAEQEFTSLRETLRHKEKEIESVLKDLRRQQADGYR